MDKKTEKEYKVCNGCKQEKLFECFSATKPGRGDKNNLRSRCKECRSAANMQWHKKNAIKSKENHVQWISENKEKVALDAKKWRDCNKNAHSLNNKLWKQKNASRNTFNSSMARARRSTATPPCLSPIQLAQIQEMYDIAVARTVQTGIKHNVDHIHPLKGNGYSGLHVPCNLRVITATENIIKKNRIPEEDKHLFWSI